MHQHKQSSSRNRDLLTVSIVAALAFLIIVLCGHLFERKWTGIVMDAGYPKKTPWDWLDLLIVPGVLRGRGLYWYF